MAINASAGARVYIGPTTSATDESDYAGLSYTEIKHVENLGEFGDQAGQITFTPLDGGRVRKFKGARDAGDVTLTAGHDPLDAGQLALRAAEASKFAYAFKVVLEDSADANDTDSTFYFHAKVMSARTNVGGANQVTMLSAVLGIDTDIIEALSEAVA